jgi:Raf kinase inhibitor-like YbhB/YbcL family protein
LRLRKRIAAMQLTSASFKSGSRIPDEFAFVVPHAETHIALGRNRNPHLKWADVPPGTRSFVLIVHDPDVPSRADDVNKEGRRIVATLPRVSFFHWILLDIPAEVREIPAGSHSNGIVARGKTGPRTRDGWRHGLNDYTEWFAADDKMKGQYYGYDGPGPPWNDELVHRYVFTLYALDIPELRIDGPITGNAVRAALAGYVLAEASLTGTYSLNPSAS